MDGLDVPASIKMQQLAYTEIGMNQFQIEGFATASNSQSRIAFEIWPTDVDPNELDSINLPDDVHPQSDNAMFAPISANMMDDCIAMLGRSFHTRASTLIQIPIVTSQFPYMYRCGLPSCYS